VAIFEILWKNMVLTERPHINMVQALCTLEHHVFSKQ